MKTFAIKTLIILFVILILLLALSVYIKPVLELYENLINVYISGQTYTGTISNKQEYVIDISGVSHTGYVDVSNNFGEQPQIVNQNFVVTGQSGNALNDTYMPGTTGSSGGNYTSPLDFLSNFQPSTGMYTSTGNGTGTGTFNTSNGTGTFQVGPTELTVDSLLPTADDVNQTTFSIPENEEAQLGTLGVDYYKCMEGDHVPALQGSAEPIGTYHYIRNHGANSFPTCAEQIAPCSQFSNDEGADVPGQGCNSFSSRAGRKLCTYTPATMKNVVGADGISSLVVDASSKCEAIVGLDPTFMVDKPVPTPTPTPDTTTATAAGST